MLTRPCIPSGVGGGGGGAGCDGLLKRFNCLDAAAAADAAAGGIAKANEKANIPAAGIITSPPAANSKTFPTIGPVQEKEISTSVKAIKKIPIKPPLSDFASILFTKELGKVISNNPKKDSANSMNTMKKIAFGIQFVANQVAKPGPISLAATTPINV